jgi:AraC-like DNA-binding protein
MVTLDQAGSAANWTRLHRPPVHLQGMVEFAWTQQVPKGAALGWRIVADTSPHLLVHRCSDGNVRVRVVGARTRWVDVPMGAREWTAGVRLQPGTLGRMAGAPAVELSDRGEDAAAVFGAAGDRLVARMDAAGSAHEALALLFDFTVGYATRPADARIVRLAGALRSRKAGRVRDIAASTGFAERTLRQSCMNEFGLSPVRFMRIERLHRTLELRVRDPALDWGTIAVRAGHADQPHMIREFRALLGESPTCFMERGPTRH